MDRREFLAAGTAMVGAGCLLAQPMTLGPAGKDAGLRVVTLDPLVLETPDRLLGAGRVTPSSVLFVRNHHGAKPFESMKPRPLEGFLEISGLVKYPRRVRLADLGKMARTEVEMVLQCSGNFRSQFSKISPIKGTPWNKGGIGNVVFGGVPVAAAFQAAKLEISTAARYLTVEGADQPEHEGQADYEKSVPLSVALDRGLLATHLNGEPLPAVHGGPLRLIIPGFYGSVQVKWLTRLRLEAAETANFFQLPDYRNPKKLIKPGAAVEYTFENSDANFEMKINSRLLSHTAGERVAAGRPFAVKGVAWNDGAAKLTAVELSADGGRTWAAAVLGPPAGPYAFREWSHTLALPAGRHEVWVRASDVLGRCQTADGGLFWNPGGYCWNGYEKVELVAG